MSGIGAYAMLFAIVALAVSVVVIDRNNEDHARLSCVHPTAMPATWFGACR